MPKQVRRKWEQDSRGILRYKTESIEISVHTHIDEDPGVLVVTTRPEIGIGRRTLKSQDPQEAKDQALEIVRQYCRKLYEELLR